MASNNAKTLNFTQEKAARMIVNSKHTSDSKICKELGIKKSLLTDWKRQTAFKIRVLQLMDANVDLERAYRVKHVGKYLTPLYKEIKRRLDDKGSLKTYSLKDLIRMMTVLHNELRIDNSFNKKFLESGLEGEDENGAKIDNRTEKDLNMNKVSDLYEAKRKKQEA